MDGGLLHVEVGPGGLLLGGLRLFHRGFGGRGLLLGDRLGGGLRGGFGLGLLLDGHFLHRLGRLFQLLLGEGRDGALRQQVPHLPEEGIQVLLGVHRRLCLGLLVCLGRLGRGGRLHGGLAHLDLRRGGGDGLGDLRGGLRLAGQGVQVFQGVPLALRRRLGCGGEGRGLLHRGGLRLHHRALFRHGGGGEGGGVRLHQGGLVIAEGLRHGGLVKDRARLPGGGGHLHLVGLGLLGRLGGGGQGGLPGLAVPLPLPGGGPGFPVGPGGGLLLLGHLAGLFPGAPAAGGGLFLGRLLDGGFLLGMVPGGADLLGLGLDRLQQVVVLDALLLRGGLGGLFGLTLLLVPGVAAEEVAEKVLLLFLLFRQAALLLLAAGVTEGAVFIGHGIVLSAMGALDGLAAQGDLFGFHSDFLLPSGWAKRTMALVGLRPLRGRRSVPGRGAGTKNPYNSMYFTTALQISSTANSWRPGPP